MVCGVCGCQEFKEQDAPDRLLECTHCGAVGEAFVNEFVASRSFMIDLENRLPDGINAVQVLYAFKEIAVAADTRRQRMDELSAMKPGTPGEIDCYQAYWRAADRLNDIVLQYKDILAAYMEGEENGTTG